jgi:hypothetical protein
LSRLSSLRCLARLLTSSALAKMKTINAIKQTKIPSPMGLPHPNIVAQLVIFITLSLVYL